jgi:hypothetical protein
MWLSKALGSGKSSGIPWRTAFLKSIDDIIRWAWIVWAKIGRKGEKEKAKAKAKAKAEAKVKMEAAEDGKAPMPLKTKIIRDDLIRGKHLGAAHREYLQ